MFGSTVGRAQARPGACRQGETTIVVSAEGSVRPASSTNHLEYRVQHRGKSAILPLVDICVGRISTLKALQRCCPCAARVSRHCSHAAPARLGWVWSFSSPPGLESELKPHVWPLLRPYRGTVLCSLVTCLLLIREVPNPACLHTQPSPESPPAFFIAGHWPWWLT